MRCEKHTAQREKRKQLIFIVSGEALQGGDFFFIDLFVALEKRKI